MSTSNLHRSMRRAGPLSVTLIGWLVLSPPLPAQIPARTYRERPLEALLFMAPVPGDRLADSAYAIELGSRMRERFGRWHRHEARLIELCEATESCGQFVPDTSADDYARSVAADFYVFGQFSREPAPTVRLHIRATGGRGGIQHHLSTIELRAEADLAAQSFAGMVNGVVGDTLGRAIAAARDARECWRQVVDREYESATSHAMNALQRFSNHASAASCLAYIYGATAQPDSQLWALETALSGDSTLTFAWQRLGDLHLMAGDTAAAVQARLREVSTDPDDIMRRVRIAQVMDELGRTEDAVALLETGVERMGDDVELRRLLVRMCMRYEMWTCAQENMGTLYALDSTLVGDTTFYLQMIGLAQARAETDVALQWTEEAMRQVDSLIDVAWERVDTQRRAARRVEQVLSRLRLTHATTLLEMGRKDSALAVYWEILEDDPGNVRAALASARLVTDGRTFGPGALTPADSEALATADSLLERVMAVSEDSAALQTVGASYLDVGGRLVQNRNAASTAAEWLEKGLGADPNGNLAARANAMLAVAIAFLVEETYEQLRTEPSCELVDLEVALIDRGMSAVSGALAEFPESAMDVGDGLREYNDLITRVSETLACDIRTPKSGFETVTTWWDEFDVEHVQVYQLHKAAR